MPADPPVDLLTGLASTRAIRRYRDEPIADDDLSTILWHATRAGTRFTHAGPPH